MATTEREQVVCLVGFRSTFFQCRQNFAAQGLPDRFLSGELQERTGSFASAWSIA
jgi:hypothetical protein